MLARQLAPAVSHMSACYMLLMVVDKQLKLAVLPVKCVHLNDGVYLELSLQACCIQCYDLAENLTLYSSTFI